ncbi:AraC family transcriptional regulator [Cohnella sp. 56]|uniref:AraC family transcriptional regulator n=1 Tax=Cohnella sp. 56 TaxID=3113722 RepID=UPI0030E99818
MQLQTEFSPAAAGLTVFYRWESIERLTVKRDEVLTWPTDDRLLLLAAEEGALSLDIDGGERLTAADACAFWPTGGQDALVCRFRQDVAFYALRYVQVAAPPAGESGADGAAALAGEAELRAELGRGVALPLAPEAITAMRALYALRETTRQPDMYRAHLLSQQIVLALLESLHRERDDGVELRRTVAATISRLTADPGADWSIGRLAREAGCSPRQYGRLFKSLTGLSPMQYVAEQRMAEARRRLLREEASLAEIAGSLGYADPFHFSRAFKRHEGVAPSFYISSRKQGMRLVAFQYLGDLLTLGLKPLGASRQLMGCRYFGNRVRGMAQAGGSVVEPDLERVRLLEPELILTFNGCHYDRYAAISPTLDVSWSLSPEERLSAVAAAVDREEEAARWIRRYRKKVEEAAERLSGPLIGCGTVSFMWTLGLPHTVQIYNDLTVLYRDLGCQPPPVVREIQGRVGHPFKSNVSIDQLPAYVGDTLLVVVSPDASSRRQFGRLTQSPIWQGLEAVRRERVFVLGEEWLREDPVSLEGQLRDLQAIFKKPRQLH